MNYQEEIDEKVSTLKAVMLKAGVVFGAALVIGAAYLAYNNHLDSKNTKAAELFFHAQEIEKSVMPKPANPEDGALQSFDAQKILDLEPAKLAEYQKILAQINSDYSATPIWALSQMRSAKLNLAQKKLEAAEQDYRNVINANLKSPLFAGLASDALGSMLEDLGQNDKALEVFQKSAAVAKNPLRPLAMLGQARVLTNLGKPGANELYEKVVKEFPETNYSRRAKVLSSAIGNKAQAGAL